MTGPIGSGWLLEGVIGEGGMGTVYRARNGSQTAAVKLLHSHLAGHPATQKRVLREAVLLEKLKHPGICQLREAGVLRGERPFLVMELLHGQTLEQRVATGTIPPAQLLKYALQVLEALAYAHERGVVHRDLKPSNLFLTAQDRVKILDFGVARSLANDSTWQSSVGELIGTPSFMAPEQASGRHDAVCQQTDIWSLGATLFTLLSGEYVHPGQTQAERLGRAMTVSPRSIRSVMPDCPETLAQMIDKALAFEIQDRFRSAVSMRCALKQVLVGETPPSVTARPSVQDSGETLVVRRDEIPTPNSAPEDTGILTHRGRGPLDGPYFIDGESIVLLEVDQGSTYASWRNVFLAVGHKPPTQVTFGKMIAHVASLANTWGEVAIITVVEATSTPQPEARAAMLEAYGDPRIRFGVFVMEARGFVAAIQRGFAATIMATFAYPPRFSIQTDFGEGMAWFVRHLGAERNSEFQEEFASTLLSFVTSAKESFWAQLRRSE